MLIICWKTSFLKKLIWKIRDKDIYLVILLHKIIIINNDLLLQYERYEIKNFNNK